MPSRQERRREQSEPAGEHEARFFPLQVGDGTGVTGIPDSVRRRLDPDARYGLRLTLFGVALALIAIPFGLLLHQVVTEGPVTDIDTALADDLSAAAQQSDTVATVLTVVSFLGKPAWLAVVIALPAVWFLFVGARRIAVYLVATSAGGGVVESIVKIAVGRPRPEIDEPLIEAFGKSFPSGHSMSSTVVYGSLLLVFFPLLSRRGRVVAAAGTASLILAIGASRLGLAVHFMSDVLGGYVLGGAWLLGATAAFGVWRVETRREQQRASRRDNQEVSG